MAIKQKQKHQPTRAAMSGTHAANASATKRGPGRYHRSGEPGSRITKPRKQRAYVALLAAWASKVIPNWRGPRDEHGAYTPVGRVYTLEGEGVEPTAREHTLGGAVGGGQPPSYTLRRKWLAGISAQRGY